MRTSFLFIIIFSVLTVRLSAQCNVSITNPAAVCYPATVDITAASVTSGSTSGLTFTYWQDASALVPYLTPTLATNGTYYIKGDNGAGCTQVQPVIVTVATVPSPPVVGTITQPTCTVSTGSVALSGLPSAYDWTITASPGGSTMTGNGTTATFSGLSAGITYTFKVANYAGCTSSSSGSAIIQSQPATPSAPVVGTITGPTCSLATGSVVLSGLPSSGTWTLKRYPGGVTSTGSGTSTTISGLSTGTYNFSVTNSSGCTSASLSDDVVIASQPSTPSAPVLGTATQPTCTVATGSVPLSGLPSSGTWTLTLHSTGTTMTGSGSTATFSGIAAGTYTFTVTAANTCTSVASSSVTIDAQPATPSAPVAGTITQPTCAVSTGSVVLSSLPSGTWTLTRSPGSVTTSGTGTSTTVSSIPQGTYTYTVTNSSGCISTASAGITINAPPSAPGTPEFTTDCTLGFGHAVLTITTPIGTGIEYSLDGGTYQSGTAFNNVTNGNHYLAVRNSDGCVTTTGIFATACGCVNPPLLTLTASSGSTCGITPVTVSENTFGGSATSVTITSNGAGVLAPASSTVAPFSFTYTPVAADAGKTITITVTTNNPLGTPCLAATGTYALTVNAIPAAPTIGTITSLTCSSSTGSIALSGLPSSGTWTLIRTPDNVSVTGSGTTTTISDLTAGTYNFTVTSAAGCISDQSAAAVVIPQPDSPTAPVIGALTQPTCTLSTGSVALSGLPSGTWTLTRLPSGTTRSGSGTTYLSATIPPGTYTYTVTNSSGCVSAQSASFTINEQPLIPATPSIGTIIAPTCTSDTGSVEIYGLPSTGTWTLTRYSPAVSVHGTGTSTTCTGIQSGTYNFTVTNQAGCTSGFSSNVVMPAQPASPSAPVVGTITQPTFTVPTGSVILRGLPSSGSWIITRLPDSVTTAGSGTTTTLSKLSGGLYNFTVTNSVGCTSPESDDVIISTPGKPTLTITNPAPVCSPGKVDLTADAVTAGSTTGLIFTYWLDEAATETYATPESADAGTYYIKGTTVSGYFDIKPVVAVILEPPVPNAGPDQRLSATYTATLAAVLGDGETGIWSIVSGKGSITDTADPSSTVTNLAEGAIILKWTVTNGACPVDSDKVTIVVGDVTIPTLITPNGDTRNEYFVIQGIESLGKTDLFVFDRRGAEVFRDTNYKNKWNGLNYNGDELPNDTYFYLIKSSKGRTLTGYIVIRR
jgi:gliding motility-associated-like protein